MKRRMNPPHFLEPARRTLGQPFDPNPLLPEAYG
jgi:hypothetical protein